MDITISTNCFMYWSFRYMEGRIDIPVWKGVVFHFQRWHFPPVLKGIHCNARNKLLFVGRITIGWYYPAKRTWLSS